MSRLFTGLTVATMLLVLTAGIAFAVVTIKGDGGDNEITGTPDDDVIRGKRGADTINAYQYGEDRVFGNRGDDDIDVADGEDNDFVDCGRGDADTVTADPGDDVGDRCELEGPPATGPATP